MISLRPMYVAAGLLLGWLAWRSLRTQPRRALFWGLLCLAFLVGDWVPDAVMGGGVVLLAVLGSCGSAEPRAESRSAESVMARQTRAAQLRGRLLVPAVLIPAVTLLSLLALRPLRVGGVPLFAESSLTLSCLGIGCGCALLAALRLTQQRLPLALDEGGRLLDAIGWAAMMPLLLATLGGVFTTAGVGGAIAEALRSLLPLHNRIVAATSYGLGMALLTAIMGNAFAAFPILTAGIGAPILVQVHHAEPASMAALGMLSGYCGTLLTPMAANFNLVPAALLGLRDPHAVIRAQAPTAFLLLAVNLILLNLLPFRMQ